jgi:hypothetical protein
MPGLIPKPTPRPVAAVAKPVAAVVKPIAAAVVKPAPKPVAPVAAKPVAKPIAKPAPEGEEELSESESEQHINAFDFEPVAKAPPKGADYPLLTVGDYLLGIENIFLRGASKRDGKKVSPMFKVAFLVLEATGDEGVTRLPGTRAAYLTLEGEFSDYFYGDIQGFLTAVLGEAVTDGEEMRAIFKDKLLIGRHVRATVVPNRKGTLAKDGTPYTNVTFNFVPEVEAAAEEAPAEAEG